MGHEFDAATAVTPLGEGRYAATLDAGWYVGGGLNGGYVIAVVGNAVRDELDDLGHPDPYTMTGYYLSASRPGPAEVRVEVLRAGRGTSTVRATLAQPEEGADGLVDRVAVLATYGDLGRVSGEVRTTARPPELPPVEDCLLSSEVAPPEFKEFVPMLDRYRMWLDPACAGWLRGKPGGNIEPDEELPKLPVACAVWEPAPDFATSAECWLTAGAAHHTVMSTAVDLETWEALATIADIELAIIDETTTVRSFAQDLRTNQVYHRLAQGF